MEKGFSLKKTRAYNLSAVLKVIMNQGPISRAHISKITKLSPTTCTATTKTLLAHGVIEEIGEGASNGGRKPILLQVNNDYGYVIGAERSSTSVRCTIYDMSMKAVHSEQILCKSNLEESFQRVIECAHKAMRNSGITQVLGMTISTEGIVDTIAHKVIGTSHLKVEEALDMSLFFEAESNFPVLVENDSNLLAYTEKKLYYPNEHSLAHIHVGNGIGAGIIMDEQIVRGRYGYIGEIGHITVDRNGPMCYCGNKGCLETMASKGALNNKISYGIKSGNAGMLSTRFEADQSDYDLKVVLDCAQEGDRFSLDLLADEVEMIYYAVVNVINMYDPEVITLSGFEAPVSDYLVMNIIEKMKHTIYGYKLQDRLIRSGHQKKDATLLGAALNSLNHLVTKDIIAWRLIE